MAEGKVMVMVDRREKGIEEAEVLIREVSGSVHLCHLLDFSITQ